MMRMRPAGRVWIAVLALVGLVGCAHLPARGALAASPMALLLVDATKTFASTARVGALAGALRATKAFDLTVRFTADQEGLYEDPLFGATERPVDAYDVVVIIPRGLDDGTADTVWIVTGISPWATLDGWGLVGLLSDLVDQVFAGSAGAVDPIENLWVSFVALVYQAEGWLG